MRRLLYWVRWWRWFVSHPSMVKLILMGVDEDSRRLIYKRWDEREPKP